MHQFLRVVTGGLMLMYTTFSIASSSGVSTVDAAWVKAMKSGDVAAAVRCYANDAVVWVTGARLAKGTKEIRAAYEGYFSAYTVNDVSVSEIGSETIGNKSVAWGTYQLTVTSKVGGTPSTVTGRYTEIAKRAGKGWVYTVDHASDDPAPPPAK